VSSNSERDLGDGAVPFAAHVRKRRVSLSVTPRFMSMPHARLASRVTTVAVDEEQLAVGPIFPAVEGVRRDELARRLWTSAASRCGLNEKVPSADKRCREAAAADSPGSPRAWAPLCSLE
jgi:hypothetical protein